MGMVSTSFKANADGSYNFALSMLSLEASDRVTKNSFYPMVCRGLQDVNNTKKHAVHFETNKSSKGDQEVKFTMIAFETVASPLLIQAVKNFFDFSSLTATIPPILEVNADDLSDTLTDAIMDAWNGKNKQKQTSKHLSLLFQRTAQNPTRLLSFAISVDSKLRMVQLYRPQWYWTGSSPVRVQKRRSNLMSII